MAPKGLIGKAPAIAVAAAYNWTGFYVGAHFGAINGRTDWEFVGVGTTTDPRFAGPSVGGQAGYDYQIGKWVSVWKAREPGPTAQRVALSARMQSSSLRKRDEVAGDRYRTHRLRLLGSLDRLREGRRRGWRSRDSRTTCNTAQLAAVHHHARRLPRRSPPVTRRGRLDVGFGSEFALSNNWTVKGETNYFDLGSTRYVTPAATRSPEPSYPDDRRQHHDAKTDGFNATVGVNYRFSTGGRR